MEGYAISLHQQRSTWITQCLEKELEKLEIELVKLQS
jgi:hypothetical protein